MQRAEQETACLQLVRDFGGEKKIRICIVSVFCAGMKAFLLISFITAVCSASQVASHCSDPFTGALANSDNCSPEQVQAWLASHPSGEVSSNQTKRISTRSLTLLDFSVYGSFVADDTLNIPAGAYITQPSIDLLTVGGSTVSFTAAGSSVSLSSNQWVPGNNYVVFNNQVGNIIITFARSDVTAIYLSAINDAFSDVTFSMEVFDTSNNSLGTVSPGLFVFSSSPPQGAWFGVRSTGPIGKVSVSASPGNDFGIGGIQFQYSILLAE